MTTVIIPTLQAEETLSPLLTNLLNGTVRSDIWVIDSTSTDRTVEIANDFRVNVRTIPRSDFNHGLTREWARKEAGGEVVVFLTQDALPNETTIEELTRPILSGEASLSYGRQVPYPDAHPIERFYRETYYPASSHIRTLRDINHYGSYTFFFSNACAAYSNTALDEIGGFRETLFGEDTVAASKLLHAGHSLTYAAEAIVLHSHPLSLSDAFRRSFDIGYSRKKNSCWFPIKTESEGRFFAKKLLKNTPAFSRPYAFSYLAFRWLGYYLGTNSTRAPSSWCRFWSSSKWYW